MSPLPKERPHPFIISPVSTSCACRSGLGHARCCGLDLTTLARPAGPGQHPDAPATEQLCLDMLEAAPGHPDALWALSRLRLAQHKPAAAEALVRRVVATPPVPLRATRNPTTSLAMVLTEALKPHVAAVHYRRALELSGRRDPILLANFALCLRMRGSMAEARALYEECQATIPLEVQILLDWAKLEEASHQVALVRLDPPCAGPTAASRCSASPPDSPTATPATGRAGCSAAPNGIAASPAPSWMAA